MWVTWATVVSMLLIQVQYGANQDFKEKRDYNLSFQMVLLTATELTS